MPGQPRQQVLRYHSTNARTHARTVDSVLYFRLAARLSVSLSLCVFLSVCLCDMVETDVYLAV